MLKDFTLSLELEPTENRVVQTAAIFWSHDVNTAKIYIELLRKGTPIILNKDVTVRVMMLFDDENKSEHIYTAKIEDELKGLVSITLEESMRMYVGQVTCGVYVDYQNEEKTDNGYFTFGMRRSLIDKDMPELKKMYVSDFEDALKGIEELKEGIDKNVDNMKERIEVIEKLITNNEVATKNELGILEDFREFDKDVISKVKNEFAERGVSVHWFGAKGDGKTDDTEAIQKAVNFSSENKVPVYTSVGKTYMIKAHVDRDFESESWITFLKNQGGVLLKSNSHLHFSTGSKFKAFETKDYAYNVLRTYNSENVKITGDGTLIGEADTHTGTIGEFGFGLAVFGGKNIYVEGLKAINFWGDGFLTDVLSESDLTPVKDMTMINCHADNNGRQGLSLQGNIGFYAKNCSFNGSYRTAPMAGVDCEPWLDESKDRNAMRDIVFEKCHFGNNHGSGFLSDGKHNQVKLINCTFSNNAKFDVETYETDTITIENTKFKDNKISLVNTNKSIFLDTVFTNSNIVNEDMNNFKGGEVLFKNCNYHTDNRNSLFRNFNGVKTSVVLDTINAYLSGGRLLSATSDETTLFNINVSGTDSLMFQYGGAVDAEKITLSGNNGDGNSLIIGSVQNVNLNNVNVSNAKLGNIISDDDYSKNNLKRIVVKNSNIPSNSIHNKSLKSVKTSFKNNVGSCFDKWDTIHSDFETIPERSVRGILMFDNYNQFSENKHMLTTGDIFLILFDGETPLYRMYTFVSANHIFEIQMNKI